ncbi:tetratricopeptide repeat protein [Flavobacterium sp.]|uniref:tetratricopeptide repeat protein n=1 Tax=Flavobacterium sp. TaxID=239 RepID=UPI002B4B4A6B|nr:tetratricopeptide repeat protein [Flavobacterium sp.]HLF51391.1 tetratricopeptide repeat protein [Flavobacterium sp.]
MKSKYVILASAILISVSTFAQKDQLKAAEKAMKGGNSAEAKNILQQAEPLIANATDNEKAQYFFLKGNALLDLATKNIDASKNQTDAAKAYLDLIAIEKTSGKSKFTGQAQNAINDIKGRLLNSAIEEGTKKNYLVASKQLRAVYDLDKKDLEKLYYAASYAVNGGDFDTALAYYDELKNANYSGEGVVYYATNKETKKEESFNTKQERDLYLKVSHDNPRDEKIPSKRGEIYKNIALILVEKGKVDEAKLAIQEARKANPEDASLIATEANLYLKAGDMATYKKLISEVLEKNPNNADLIFNLGVISYNNKELIDAEKYYLKAIEVDPKYSNAYLNLAILKLDAEKTLIDQMNKLGNTPAENKKYEVLKKKREDVFKSAIPYLEKVVEFDEKNAEASRTLLNVYNALEMTDKAKALKAKINK